MKKSPLHKQLLAIGFMVLFGYADGPLSVAAQPNSGWRQLFNGIDLSGWKHVGDGSMYVG